MSYPQNLEDLSEKEKLQYYKSLSQMTSKEREEDKRARAKEMIEEGTSPSEALLRFQGEEQEARELLRDEQERAKGKGREEIPEFEETSEPESESELKADFLNLKHKVTSGFEKAEELGEEIAGTRERKSLKELAFSGASKLYSSLKGKPKTPQELSREKELKEAFTSERHRAQLRKAKESGYASTEPRKSSGEPSLRDLGKGSLGAERYESSSPDFFGKSSGFDMGVKSPIGRTEKRRTQSPPSTRIPFGGSRAPDTGIPFGGNKPPSVAFSSGRKVPSTYVPQSKGRTPSVKFTGARKVSTRVPKGERKAPVRLEKRGRPISTKIGKPSRIKTTVPRQEEDDVLGLKNFW